MTAVIYDFAVSREMKLKGAEKVAFNCPASAICPLKPAADKYEKIVDIILSKK